MEDLKMTKYANLKDIEKLEFIRIKSSCHCCYIYFKELEVQGQQGKKYIVLLFGNRIPTEII